MLSLRYFEPCPELRPYITSFYCVVGTLGSDELLCDHLLPSAATVRIELKGNWTYRFGDSLPSQFPKVALVGPTSVPMEVTTCGPFALMGADLTPLGLILLWTTCVSGIVNRVVDYTPHLPAAGLDENMVLNFEPMQAIFKNLFAPKRKVPLPVNILQTVATIERHLQWENNEEFAVANLVGALNLSERQAERTTTRYFGFSPKLLLRRSRFLRAVELILANPNADWQDVSGSAYFDQSHFCREFKNFCNITPTQFFKRHQFLFEAAGVDFRKAGRAEELQVRDSAGYEFSNETPKTKSRKKPAAESVAIARVRPRSTLDFVSHLSR
jgi:AraC-like DNA-binding protein